MGILFYSAVFHHTALYYSHSEPTQSFLLFDIHVPTVCIICMETMRAQSCCSCLLIRACDLMKVFCFFFKLRSQKTYHRAMRINIIRMICQGKVSSDGRRPDTVMGYFSPVFHSHTQSTVDKLACYQMSSLGASRGIQLNFAGTLGEIKNTCK